MQTVPTISQLAREAAAQFETRHRDERGRYVTTKDDAPEWISDLARHAHGDFLPDDWRYDKIQDALDHIADLDAETPADAADNSGEFADQAVDTYTGDRIEWLASNLNRPTYCDEAAETFGAADNIVDAIGRGQYMEAEEIYTLVLEALDEHRDTLEAQAELSE